MSAQRKKMIKVKKEVAKLKESQNRSCGSFSCLLTIAFIVLKLCHVIEWSWLWVLSPIWIGAIVVVVCAIIAVKLDK